MIKFKKFDKLSVEEKRIKCLPLIKEMQKELKAKQNEIIKVERTEEQLAIYFSDRKIILKGWIADNIFVTARRGFGL